ncbi:MAG: hypothetical protein ABW185_23040 [Sedimenticola sp.]
MASSLKIVGIAPGFSWSRRGWLEAIVSAKLRLITKQFSSKCFPQIRLYGEFTHRHSEPGSVGDFFSFRFIMFILTRHWRLISGFAGNVNNPPPLAEVLPQNGTTQRGIMYDNF